jgi:transcriptional regulator with XRE-family HTH domain
MSVLTMPVSFHTGNFSSSANFSCQDNDGFFARCYTGKMKAKSPKKPKTLGHHIPVYVDEWLSAKGMRRTDLIEKTGWTPGFVSKLAARNAAPTETVILKFSEALELEYAEVFMPPMKAEAIRTFIESAHSIVSESKSAYNPEPPIDPFTPKKDDS